MATQQFGTVAAILVAGLAAAPAAQAALVADGVTYTLSESFVTATQEQFTLTITGINAAGDTEGGRSGVNALAFTQPANFVSATLTSPPSGWTFVTGGLNSSGCDGAGNFFCFDNTSIPPTPSTALAANSSLSFTFTVTTSVAGSFASYVPDFKIDWVGSKNNYDLVSLPLSPTPAVPEPQTYAMLIAGIGALAYLTRRRRTS